VGGANPCEHGGNCNRLFEFCICTAGVVLYALLKPVPARAPKASSSTSATATAPLAATELAAYE
jgi:hypothetical protein